MELSKRIKAFAGVVLFFSLLPAAYLIGELRGAQHRVETTGDPQANASGFQPLQKLDPPARKLNRTQADPSAGTDPWQLAPAAPNFGSGDPFAQMRAEMNAMHERMDAIFGQMHAGFSTDLGGGFGLQDLGAEETKDSYVYRFQADGLDQGSLKVSITDNQLSVSGQFTQASGGVSTSSAFSKMSTLPGPADPATLKTEVKDGVLTVTVNKSSAKTPRNTLPPMAGGLLH